MANQLETMQLFDSVMVGPSSNRIWIVASSLFLSISTSPPSGSVDFGCDCAKKTNKQTKNDSESPAEPLSRTQFAATSDRDLADELLSLFSKCSVENYVGGATFRCFFFFCAIGTGETAVTRRRPDQHCRSFIVVVFIFFCFSYSIGCRCRGIDHSNTVVAVVGIFYCCWCWSCRDFFGSCLRLPTSPMHPNDCPFNDGKKIEGCWCVRLLRSSYCCCFVSYDHHFIVGLIVAVVAVVAFYCFAGFNVVVVVVALSAVAFLFCSCWLSEWYPSSGRIARL